MTFRVQRRMCATCIYRPDSPLDLAKLEDDVRDPYMGFKGHRICHHSKDVCCRGFWEAHKDEFPAGQIAQRLDLVEFVDVDTLAPRRETKLLPGAAGSIRPISKGGGMPNREIKEQRGGVGSNGRLRAGPADPETRNRLLAEALSGTKKARDTSTSVAGTRAANNDMGAKPAPRSSNPAGAQPRGDFASGVEKVMHPKKNIERQLNDAGA